MSNTTIFLGCVVAAALAFAINGNGEWAAASVCGSAIALTWQAFLGKRHD